MGKTNSLIVGKSNSLILMTLFARMNDPEEEAGDGKQPDDRNNWRPPVNHGAENNETDQVQFHSMPSQSNDDRPHEDSDDAATLLVPTEKTVSTPVHKKLRMPSLSTSFLMIMKHGQPMKNSGSISEWSLSSHPWFSSSKCKSNGVCSRSFNVQGKRSCVAFAQRLDQSKAVALREY